MGDGLLSKRKVHESPINGLLRRNARGLPEDICSEKAGNSPPPPPVVSSNRVAKPIRGAFRLASDRFHANTLVTMNSGPVLPMLCGIKVVGTRFTPRPLMARRHNPSVALPEKHGQSPSDHHRQ